MGSRARLDILEKRNFFSLAGTIPTVSQLTSEEDVQHSPINPSTLLN
jgi:hypothetical protein